MKICGRCRLEKEYSCFNKDKSRRDGYQAICKKCVGIRASVYNQENRAKVNETYRNRYKTDINYKIAKCLRSRIRLALKRNQKIGNTLDLLGCSVDVLKSHLEKQFDSNMTWENYGTYWHIDHVKPCDSFDLSDKNNQNVCFHYSNLQPLEAIANIKKGNK